MVLSSTIRTIFIISILTILATIGLMGCSTSNPDSPFSLIDETGGHPDGWTTGHQPFAFPDGSLCIDCHGDDLLGGISGVSCGTDSFGGAACHSSGPAFHPIDWVNRDATGNTWHANAYQNNVTVGGLTCEQCHTPPDLDVQGGKCLECHFTIAGSKAPSGGAYSHPSLDGHSDTTAFDETVCISCHEVSINFGYLNPGCHNCHEPFPSSHPAGWDASGAHGAAAMGNPDSTSGFSYCQSCHGDNFAGGAVDLSCLTLGSCHDLAAPHGTDWQSRHDNTDQDNAVDCGLCHLGDPNPPVYQPLPSDANPGCMNDTLCHGVEN